MWVPGVRVWDALRGYGWVGRIFHPSWAPLPLLAWVRWESVPLGEEPAGWISIPHPSER